MAAIDRLPRFAVISDVHANMPALRAVDIDIRRRGIESVFHLGDLVLQGPSPCEVVDFVRRAGWVGVRGNCDEALWTKQNNVQCKWTREALGDERTRWLRQLPSSLLIDGSLFLHGSRESAWCAPEPAASDAEISNAFFEGGTPDPGVKRIFYGHTHKPVLRVVSGVSILNPGSVGMPGDNDWRASWAEFDNGEGRIHKTEYALNEEVAAIRTSRVPFGNWLASRRRTGGYVNDRPSGSYLV